MKVQGSLDTAVSQLKRAHQEAGHAAAQVRDAAEPFYARLSQGSMFSEAKLKLKLAFSPSSREAMSELWKIVFQSGDGAVDRHNALTSWLATNKPLVGFMSADAQKMLTSLAARGDEAKAIDAGIHRAEEALAAAFGTPVVSKEQRQALSSFAFEANTSGHVVRRFERDIDALSRQTAALFVPGAKEALRELRVVLTNPNATETERRDAFNAFRGAHPKLVSLLDLGRLASMGRDLSVADWSDSRFQAAEDALRAAFAKPA
jgi:hypothetical protein